MLKFCCKLIVLSSLFCSTWLYAQTEADEQDEYNQCVDQTIKEMQLESINNRLYIVVLNKLKRLMKKKLLLSLIKFVHKAKNTNSQNVIKIF